jgi:hypothetical protein
VDADHVDADTARLIGDYVNLLAALRADAAPADDEHPDDADLDDDRPEVDLPEVDLPEATGDDEPAGDETFAPAVAVETRTTRPPEALPRSVILAGEIAAAREARRALAFALVTRADAETLLADEARADAAETDLAALLRAAPRVRRVESFGPLLLAVFLDAEADQVPTWAKSLGGPAVRVGAVAPAAGDPEAVRRAAARALERAYADDVVCLLAD